MSVVKLRVKVELKVNKATPTAVIDLPWVVSQRHVEYAGYRADVSSGR